MSLSLFLNSIIHVYMSYFDIHVFTYIDSLSVSYTGCFHAN